MLTLQPWKPLCTPPLWLLLYVPCTIPQEIALHVYCRDMHSLVFMSSPQTVTLLSHQHGQHTHNFFFFIFSGCRFDNVQNIKNSCGNFLREQSGCKLPEYIKPPAAQTNRWEEVVIYWGTAQMPFSWCLTSLVRWKLEGLGWGTTAKWLEPLWDVEFFFCHVH